MDALNKIREDLQKGLDYTLKTNIVLYDQISAFGEGMLAFHTADIERLIRENALMRARIEELIVGYEHSNFAPDTDVKLPECSCNNADEVCGVCFRDKGYDVKEGEHGQELVKVGFYCSNKEHGLSTELCEVKQCDNCKYNQIV